MKPSDVVDGYLNNKKFQRQNQFDLQWHDLDVTELSLERVKRICEQGRIRLKPEPLKIETVGHYLGDRFAVRITKEDLDKLDKIYLYKVTIEEIEK